MTMTTSSSPPSHRVLPSWSELHWVQGSFTELDESPIATTLVLLVQPNCPGCHQAALPLVQELYEDLQQQASPAFQIVIVSTAFEDFKYNTVESLERLVFHQELVGVSRQRLGPSSEPFYKQLSNLPNLPIAHDVVVDKAEASAADLRRALDATREQVAQQLSSGLHLRQGQRLRSLLKDLDHRVLPQKLARYFYAVRAVGTPTWVVVQRKRRNEKDQEPTNGNSSSTTDETTPPDAEHVMLDQRFGHATKDELISWVEKSVSDSGLCDKE